VTGRLIGRRIVVTRAAEQVGRLRQLLADEGAMVVEIPTIAIVEPADHGDSLRAALRDVWDWVVVTSPNGAERAVDAAGGRAAALALRWAVVGPGTSAALQARGVVPSLSPERFLAEGLLDAFPRPPADHRGRVLVAQAERARPALTDGLREQGWEVTTVTAYRTVPVRPSAELGEEARAADAVAFTSGSTVEGFLAAAGLDALPPVAAAIGPVTAAEAQARGVRIAAVAEPHTLEGLVTALTAALAEPAPGVAQPDRPA
jgi:uroporphyrinogen-III synthase